MKPLVSIVIPVYNGSDYLKQAIDSALAQTYDNVEVIVINDGSNDNGKTEQLAMSYGNKIRYYHKANGGVSSALNMGIQLMNGEYFSWLSHDDMYNPLKVESQVSMLNKYKLDKAVVMCSCVQIDSNSELLKVQRQAGLYEENILDWTEAVSHITKFSANGCSLLIPKAVFEECGGFDERLHYCQDIFMWWKIFLNGYSLITSDYKGVLSRVHSRQLTQTGVSLYKHDALLIGKEIIPMFVDKSTRENNFIYEYAKGEAIHGNKEVVKLCIECAKAKSLLTVVQNCTIKILNFYGNIRPIIRQLYYRFIKRVKI